MKLLVGLIIAAALLLQWFPLRVCALSELASGSSCHDADWSAAPADTAVAAAGGCASHHDGSAAGQCVCEEPQAPHGSVTARPMPPLTFAQASPLLAVYLLATHAPGCGAQVDRPPPSAAADRSIPLLI